MATLFNYQTPSKFSAAFKEFYMLANLRQVRMLSAVFFIISALFRLLSFFYYDEIIKVPNYDSYSIINWIQMGGTFFFFMSSSLTLKVYKDNRFLKKSIPILFVILLLLTSFSASYTVSMDNTKNTLTLFFIGITTVSLFFALEYLEITFI
ncbi:MAG TPA: hypothetical protein VL088_03540, partial [Pedobacter sp.]|nr:hypothetical protein [Pedobacter sp.]